MRRSKDIQVNLEPIVYQQTVDLAAKLGNSASGYIRSLIVRDLRERGLLTEAMLADMAVAGS